ncbi:MAG: hypothetical protein HWE39_09360 [Oceanospirillaceae bacterium]|uniref:hypothetical protein n=1 Tax=Salipiger sp. HF18 TaxID=2721557 RepID=UPI00142E555F|nr:hypothetical protein [Salipiger sp. HF18]NIY95863.1 hypothetical protein [Salipiger sp. HF18]NVK41440.1 hypothetical protein [Oceanospirillaceae bacterium]
MPTTFSRTGALVALCAAILLGACKEEDNPLLDTFPGKLAAIDADTLGVTEAQVKPYAEILERLKRKCSDDESGISDTAVKARDIFRTRKGMEVSTLSVLRMIDEAIPEGVTLSCDEIVAAIITLS